jgi:hypothetical protein
LRPERNLRLIVVALRRCGHPLSHGNVLADVD